MVLVEFSFIRQPMDLKDKLFQLQIKGYQPIIAHPERYLYFGAHKTVYDELHDMDCIFQLNLLSLCGYYGKKQEELAQYLIKKKYVSLLGSDLSQHQAHQYPPCLLLHLQHCQPFIGCRAFVESGFTSVKRKAQSVTLCGLRLFMLNTQFLWMNSRPQGDENPFSHNG